MTTRFTQNSQFHSDAMEFYGKSASGTAPAAATTAIDYTLTADVCLTGVNLAVSGARWGDRVSFQVVHPVAGVINTFVDNWYMVTDRETQFDVQIPYPANVPAGLILRASITTTAEAGDRLAVINFYLHRVVV